MRLEEINNQYIDGVFRDYWEPFIKDIPYSNMLTGYDLDMEVWDYLMYFAYEPITRYVYNYPIQPNKVFEHNMERVADKYSLGVKEKTIIAIKNKCKEIEELMNGYEFMAYDEKYGDITFHCEYIWVTENGKNTCDVCHSYNGKTLETIKNLHPHFNCRCMIEQHTWWTTEDGKILYEDRKLL